MHNDFTLLIDPAFLGVWFHVTLHLILLQATAERRGPSSSPLALL